MVCRAAKVALRIIFNNRGKIFQRDCLMARAPSYILGAAKKKAGTKQL
jgi:hypothetical protein